jgi:hypothetical protein
MDKNKFCMKCVYYPVCSHLIEYCGYKGFIEAKANSLKMNINFYIPRKNGRIRKPHLSFCKTYFTNDKPPYKDIGFGYAFHIGWIVMNINFYY